MSYLNIVPSLLSIHSSQGGSQGENGWNPASPETEKICCIKMMLFPKDPVLETSPKIVKNSIFY